MKICINIGHGGDGANYDSGAIAADGTHEHRFIRDELAPLVFRALLDAGHEGYAIGQSKSFSELPAKINATRPDRIISLHFNAYNRTASGSETLYWHSSRAGKALATAIQKQVVAALGLNDRGIKPRFPGDRGAALLQRTAAPCVIVEPFFGDNPTDLARARERIGALALAIAAGAMA